MSAAGDFIREMAASPFDKQEPEIRRYWRADRAFDALQDGFDRLSALAMLAEIDRLRASTTSDIPQDVAPSSASPSRAAAPSSGEREA